MSALFDVCRAVTAYEAARRAGLHLKRSGSRWFACCPFHREHTPSLCFFPDGGYKCFGCGSSGDAVSFYAKLYGLAPLDAARRLLGDFGLAEPALGSLPPVQKKGGRELMQAAEAWKAGTWNRLCDIKHRAVRMLDAAQSACAAPEACWESEKLVMALQARDAAEMGLNLLESATPAQLLDWAAEGGD
jgi:hypothetical protein